MRARTIARRLRQEMYSTRQPSCVTFTELPRADQALDGLPQLTRQRDHCARSLRGEYLFKRGAHRRCGQRVAAVCADAAVSS